MNFKNMFGKVDEQHENRLDRLDSLVSNVIKSLTETLEVVSNQSQRINDLEDVIKELTESSLDFTDESKYLPMTVIFNNLYDEFGEDMVAMTGFERMLIQAGWPVVDMDWSSPYDERSETRQVKGIKTYHKFRGIWMSVGDAMAEVIEESTDENDGRKSHPLLGKYWTYDKAQAYKNRI